MNSKTITFDSNEFTHDEGSFCNRMEIEVSFVRANSDFNQYGSYTIKIFDTHANCKREWNDFSQEEQNRIDRIIENQY